MFAEQYEGIEPRTPRWNELPVAGGALFEWNADSTYVQEPPFFIGVTPEVAGHRPHHAAPACS